MKNIGGFTGAKNFRSKSEFKRKEIMRKAAPIIKRKETPKLKGIDSTVVKKPTVPRVGKTGMKRFLGGDKFGKIKRKKI